MRQKMKRSRLLLPAALLCSLWGVPAKAQLTESYTHEFDNYDIKHYATTLLPGKGLSLMAGTMFDPSGGRDNSIHLLLSQYGGGSSPATLLVSRQFNDPSYDERAIGAHFVKQDQNDIVIVAARIDVNLINTQDEIAVIRTDGSGNLVSTVSINSLDFNLYPLGTLEEQGMLYICGYTTRKTTSNYPQHPEFQTRKQVMVLQYDLMNNVVVASRQFDYIPPGQPPIHDYDMAIRMKRLSNGNLFVTGSCNARKTGSRERFCGTLSLVLDNGLNIVSDKPFCSFSPPLLATPNLRDVGENGFDIMEDPASGGYFIFGNMFTAESSFIPHPMFFQITYVDALMNPLSNNRYMFHDYDYAWGINIVQGDQPQEAILSGYQSNRYGPNQNYLPTTSHNVNPFLAKYNLSYDFSLGNINASPVFWSTILSDAGTGIQNLDPNSFWEQGGYFSNVAWGPITTARDGTFSKNIFFSGPIWGPKGNGKLNMKMMNTDQNGQMQFCPFYDIVLPKDHLYGAPASILLATVLQSNFTLDGFYTTETETNLHPDAILDCGNDGIYKPTAIQPSVIENEALTIMPNPAHDYIMIQAATQDPEAPVVVSLSDIAGKRIADIYNGKQSGLAQRKLNLPELAGGLYIVTVRSGSRLLKTQKLEVR